ncbi:MAG TPA: hypothetical protein VMT68_16645 [Caulobacteraceae bacterium]|nr:hypothetical protein [Caulobacteraceae bacterium]
MKTSPVALAAHIDAKALARLRSHAGFWAACEGSAARATERFASLDPTHQWVMKDVGRASICLTALTLHLMRRLTMQTLTTNCLAVGIASAGRVQQLVRRCLEAGAMELEDGSGIWTRRPIRLARSLVESMRERALVDLTSAAQLAPEVAGAVDLASSDEGFVSYIVAIAGITSARRDLFAFSGGSPMTLFLDREAGMAMLLDLIGAQASDRQRLLEEAPISRYALSRRYGVSRAHINKMLAESGDIAFAAGGKRIVFSPALSEALEAHYALIFELNRLAATSLLSGWRFEARGA